MLLAPCIMAAHTAHGAQHRARPHRRLGKPEPRDRRHLVGRRHPLPRLPHPARRRMDRRSPCNISPVFAAWMSPILRACCCPSRSRSGPAAPAMARPSPGTASSPPRRNSTRPPSSGSPTRRTPRCDPALDASVARPPRHHRRRRRSLRQRRPCLAARTLRNLASGRGACRALPHRSGPAGISKNELSELLYLAPAMLMMHRAVWLRSAEGIHSVWTQAVESYRRRLDQPSTSESI